MAASSRSPKATTCRPILPFEILFAITNELANDRKTLLVLLLVSPSFNKCALGHIYREICLSPNSPLSFKDGPRFRRLLHGIETNPGLRFVRSFAFRIIPCFTYKKDNTNQIWRVIPLLHNVRRLSLDFAPPEGAGCAILPLIPRSAGLTSLALHQHLCRPGDLIRLRERHPMLTSLTVTSGPLLADAAVQPSTFPNLRSLGLLVEDILRITSLPSLLDLSVYGTVDVAAARHIVGAFPVLRTLSLSVDLAFGAISSLTAGLPRLEYLSASVDVHDIGTISSDYARAVSAPAQSKLKYLRFRTSDHSYNYDDVRFVFDSVKTMVVLDMILDFEELRFTRDLAQPSKLARRSSKAWSQWWEQEEEVVECAVLKYESSRTMVSGHNL
ncbi:hypothetical protein EYR36_010000 [Pleurotus pulmonarius]|nr:hypothetical protein EYR36_010000 [Pleurotus pulmonarius]KAF4593475.1 hypothetical protein EYR38_009190 [Pleurotus pulmonarius]